MTNAPDDEKIVRLTKYESRVGDRYQPKPSAERPESAKKEEPASSQEAVSYSAERDFRQFSGLLKRSKHEVSNEKFDNCSIKTLYCLLSQFANLSKPTMLKQKRL